MHHGEGRLVLHQSGRSRPLRHLEPSQPRHPKACCVTRDRQADQVGEADRLMQQCQQTAADDEQVRVRIRFGVLPRVSKELTSAQPGEYQAVLNAN